MYVLNIKVHKPEAHIERIGGWSRSIDFNALLLMKDRTTGRNQYGNKAFQQYYRLTGLRTHV
jgi:hypothetical protein